MAQRLLAPPSSPLSQDIKLVRDSESLLTEILNEEIKLVIFDNNIKEVSYADLKPALTTVAADISIISGQDIGRSHDNFGHNDNSEHVSEEEGNVDQKFVFCKDCINYKRVETHDELKRGDSIRFPRIEGLYYHHAIVKEVTKRSNSSICTLTLIHLQKVDGILTQVKEDTKTYNLRKDIVEIVIYKSNRFTPDEIIQQAEKYAAENRTPRVYDVFGNNCEQLSNQFAQGVKISIQVYSKLEKVKSGLVWILNVLCRIGSRITQIPEIATFASSVSLIHIMQKITQLENFSRDGIVCFCCYDKAHKQLKKSLVMGLISLAVSVISHFNWSTLTISCIISTALPSFVEQVYEYIMPLIQPSFIIPKLNLGKQNKPKAGDIITFDYQNLPHEGVVSFVHEIGSDMTRFKAAIIHFPWPGLFGTYTVTKETIYLNKTDEVFVLDFGATNHLSASDVVKRAKDQLGKQNHDFAEYRSSHLSRFCKTGKKRLETLPTVPVRSINDLSPGNVIRFRYCGLPHEAVLVRIEQAEYIRVNVIHYNYTGMVRAREVVNDEMTFKLSDKNVLIHDYANVEVYEPDEVVRRAKAKIGEQKFNMFTNRSSHFAQSCKIKTKLTRKK